MKKSMKLLVALALLISSAAMVFGAVSGGCASGHIENPDGSCCLYLGAEGNTGVYSCTDGEDWWHGYGPVQ